MNVQRTKHLRLGDHTVLHGARAKRITELAQRAGGKESLHSPVWDPATGRFDVRRLRWAIVVRGWTPSEFAERTSCSRTSVYKALAGHGVRDRTALAILQALAHRQPRLPAF